MLETCISFPGPIRLSVKKTKNFDQVRPPPPVLETKMDQILQRPVFPFFDAP